MQLISTIINELTDVDISLTSPLLKTKVLASRIRHEELKIWAGNELIGYSNIKSLPSYRITKGEICADYINGRYHVTSQPIPMPAFDEEITDRLYTMHFTQSLQNLESLAASNSGYLTELFEPEQKKVLVHYLESQNAQARILNISIRTPANFLVDILANIRARLLDFALQLEEKYEFVTEIKELGLHNNEITHIMNSTINNNVLSTTINSTGTGNTITTGSNNDITR